MWPIEYSRSGTNCRLHRQRSRRHNRRTAAKVRRIDQFRTAWVYFGRESVREWYRTHGRPLNEATVAVNKSCLKGAGSDWKTRAGRRTGDVDVTGWVDGGRGDSARKGGKCRKR